MTVLMSDIVGSTRLWAEHEAAMVEDLRLHDEVTTTVVATNGGRVVKHTGDGVIAVFDDAADAVRAGAALQAVVQDATWMVPDGIRVRIAAHSGLVHERDVRLVEQVLDEDRLAQVSEHTAHAPCRLPGAGRRQGVARPARRFARGLTGARRSASLPP